MFSAILFAPQSLSSLELDKGALSGSIYSRLPPQQYFKDFLHKIHTGVLTHAFKYNDYDSDDGAQSNHTATKPLCMASTRTRRISHGNNASAVFWKVYTKLHVCLKINK